MTLPAIIKDTSTTVLMVEFPYTNALQELESWLQANVPSWELIYDEESSERKFHILIIPNDTEKVFHSQIVTKFNYIWSLPIRRRYREEIQSGAQRGLTFKIPLRLSADDGVRQWLVDRFTQHVDFFTVPKSGDGIIYVFVDEQKALLFKLTFSEIIHGTGVDISFT